MWFGELKEKQQQQQSKLLQTICYFYSLNRLFKSEGSSDWMKALLAFDPIQAFKCFDSPLIFPQRTAHINWHQEAAMLLQDYPRCITQTRNMI